MQRPGAVRRWQAVRRSDGAVRRSSGGGSRPSCWAPAPGLGRAWRPSWAYAPQLPSRPAARLCGSPPSRPRSPPLCAAAAAPALERAAWSRLRSAGRPPSLSTSAASVKRLRDRSTSRRQPRCVAIQSGSVRSRLSERLSHSRLPKLLSMKGSDSMCDASRSRLRILERAASDVPVSSASADGSSSWREGLEEVLPASGLPRCSLLWARGILATSPFTTGAKFLGG
eukprot:scaffold2076_cov52-Phaeocystis_antarctica.AAC.2